MATTVKCPKCAADIPMGGLSAGGDVQCPGCGKRLKVKASRRVDEASSGNAPQPAAKEPPAKENDIYALAGSSDFLVTPPALGELNGATDLSPLEAPLSSASPTKKLPSSRPPSLPKKSLKQKPQTKGAGARQEVAADADIVRCRRRAGAVAARGRPCRCTARQWRKNNLPQHPWLATRRQSRWN